MGCIDWFVLGLLMVGGVLLVALLTVIEFAIGLLIGIWRRLTRFAANICRNRRRADGRSPRRPSKRPGSLALTSDPCAGEFPVRSGSGKPSRCDLDPPAAELEPIWHTDFAIDRAA